MVTAFFFFPLREDRELTDTPRMVTETIPVTRTPGRVYARRTFLVASLHICVCACIVGNLFLLHRFLHLHCRFCIIIIIIIIFFGIRDCIHLYAHAGW